MASLLPPAPQGVPPGHSFWNQWYEQLRVLINSISGSAVSWVTINFSGSNITDIVNRGHNSLQSFQGGAAGEYFHLTSAQSAKVVSLYLVNTKAGLPVVADIPSNQWAIYKDTIGGSLRLWANDSGTLKSIILV